MLAVITLLILSIYRFNRFPGPLPHAFSTELNVKAVWWIQFINWVLELCIFLGYLLAYFTRANARSVARGFMEVAFPFIIAGIPMLIFYSPFSFPEFIPHHSHFYLPAYLSVMSMMVFGVSINLIGLMSMRKAFTIMSEARVLIRRGIFSIYSTSHLSGPFNSIFLQYPAAAALVLRLAVQSVRVGNMAPDAY